MIAKAIQTIGIRLVGTAATFALSLLVARMLGAEGAGVFFFGLAILVGGATLGRFGLTEVSTRYVSSNETESGSYAGSAIVIVACFSSLVALAVWFFGPSLITQINTNGKALALAIATFAFAIPALALTVVMCGILQGYKRPVIGSFLETGLTPILVVISAVFMVMLSLSTLIWVYVAMSFIALACTAVIVWQSLGDNRLPDRAKISEMIHAGHPLLVVNMMGYIIRFAPLLCLGAFAAPAETGIYAIVMRLGMIFGIILQSLNNVLRPAFALAYKTKALDDLQKQVQSAGVFLLIVGLPLIGGLLLLRGQILSLFGPEFIQGGVALMILLFGQTINLLTASSGAVLAMTGNERQLRTNTIITALVCLVLCLTLIPLLGVNGAALATALSIALQGLLAAAGVYRKVGVWPFVSLRTTKV